MAKPWVAVVDAGPIYDPFAECLQDGGIPTFRSADRALQRLNVFVQERFGNRLRARRERCVDEFSQPGALQAHPGLLTVVVPFADGRRTGSLRSRVVRPHDRRQPSPHERDSTPHDRIRDRTSRGMLMTYAEPPQTNTSQAGTREGQAAAAPGQGGQAPAVRRAARIDANAIGQRRPRP